MDGKVVVVVEERVVILVEVEVEIPSRLTKEQVDKLNAFASALDENRNQPACVEFADKAARYLKGK